LKELEELRSQSEAKIKALEARIKELGGGSGLTESMAKVSLE
jgi:hypothetical protein